MTKKLPRKLVEDERILLIRSALGDDAELHLVGGAVRDAMLGRTLGDIDLATALRPEEVVDRLTVSGIRVVPTGLSHQTVLAVPIADNPGIEITSFRGAGMTPDGGLVLGESISEDLSYRDFTINAIAYDLSKNEIIDPQQGLLDLHSRTVRAVGEPKDRFSEDPLRVLRMVRFSCLAEFTIEPSTLESSTSFCEPLKKTAVERIREEFNKILISENPGLGLRLLHTIGALEAVFPEIVSFVDFEQNRFHHLDLFEHTIAVIEGTEPQLSLRLGALLHDIGKPSTLSIDENGDRHFYKHESVGAELARDFLKRFRYPTKVVEAVETLVRTHMRPLQAGDGGLRRLLRDTGEHYGEWRKLKEAEALACKIESESILRDLSEFDERMELVAKGPQVSPLRSLALNGRDLMQAGIPEGPQIGEALRALHERVLDEPELNTKEQLLSLLGDFEQAKE